LHEETLEEEEEDVEMEIGDQTVELEDEDRTEDENNNQKLEDEEEEEEEEGAKKMTKGIKYRNGKSPKSDSIRLKRPLWILKQRFDEQDNQAFKLVELREETQSFDKEFVFIFDYFYWIND